MNQLSQRGKFLAKEAIKRSGHPAYAEDGKYWIAQASDRGISLSFSVWKRFLAGIAIRPATYIVLCQLLRLDPEAVRERSDSPETSRYLHREAHQRCYAALSEPGALVRVGAARKMGKTALAYHSLRRLQEQGFDVIRIKFDLYDSLRIDAENSSFDRFLREFCNDISDQLDLSANINWARTGSPETRCREYIAKAVLPNRRTGLVLALDNFEQVFQGQLDRGTRFCNLLASWFTDVPLYPELRKLRTMVLYSSEVNSSLYSSPLNGKGEGIELEDLTDSEIRQLAQNHALALDDGHLNALKQLYAGHPFLIEQAFSHVRNRNMRIVDFLDEQQDQPNPNLYRSHLQELSQNLQQRPHLREMLGQLVETDEIQVRGRDRDLARELSWMGLVRTRENNGRAEIYCGLYRLYFQERFLSD